MTMVMVGPLAPWASGMAERLTTLGYTPRVAELHMRLARGLSRFLQQCGVTAEELSLELISRFLGTVRWSGRRPTPKMLAWMVDYLRDVGVAQEPIVRQPRSEQQLLVARYREYLTVEHGLEPCTIANYGRVVTLFLTVHAGRGLDELTAADISRFMTSQCQQISVRAAERLATGLRSFLGFALVEGLINMRVRSRRPSHRVWSGASIRASTSAAVRNVTIRLSNWAALFFPGGAS